jgi:hypothetical protein
VAAKTCSHVENTRKKANTGRKCMRHPFGTLYHKPRRLSKFAQGNSAASGALAGGLTKTKTQFLSRMNQM